MKKILIIGGAGFIGINASKFFLEQGASIIILDNFSRVGTQNNLKWLKEIFPYIEVIKADISKDRKILNDVIEKVDYVLHLAAQVAVTLSVTNPRLDFESNALGTFNVLEAIRTSSNNPSLLYTSTNKVYGKMDEVKIIEEKGRYAYADLKSGVSETTHLDFHSPYGCSKGSADQYVRDYSRIYGLKTVVFRQSCIYGIHQFGMEDQGWVAWFTIQAALNNPITIYGDGKQVRDVLFIEDLCKAFVLAFENIEKISGNVYNIGGGPDKTLSLLELIGLLENFLGRKLKINFSDWRPGDQKVFICDTSKINKELNWEPQITPSEGVKKLLDWVLENKNMLNHI